MDIEETHTVLNKKHFFVVSIYFSSKTMPNTSVSEEVKREKNMSSTGYSTYKGPASAFIVTRFEGYDVNYKLLEIARAAVENATTCCERSVPRVTRTFAK